jgi:integrase/recombinase XerD
MNTFEQKRFDELYRKHLRVLKLQGMSDKTIDAYSRAVRRISPGSMAVRTGWSGFCC